MDNKGLKDSIDDLCVELVNITNLIQFNRAIFDRTAQDFVKSNMLSHLKDNVRAAIRITNSTKALLEELFKVESAENLPKDLKYRKLYNTLCQNHFPNI